jgi:hypothetical protein
MPSLFGRWRLILPLRLSCGIWIYILAHWTAGKGYAIARRSFLGSWYQGEHHNN